MTTSVRKETITVLSSCDDLDKLVINVERLVLAELIEKHVFLVVNLWSRKSRNGPFTLENRQMDLYGIIDGIELSIPAKSVGIWSLVEIEIWKASARDLARGDDGYLGTISFPVFNRRGILVTGKHVFMVQNDLQKYRDIAHHMFERSRIDLIIPSNEQEDSSTQKTIEEYRFFHASNRRSTEWTLPQMSEEKILSGLVGDYCLLHLNPGVPITVYTDQCKAPAIHFGRQSSMTNSPLLTPSNPPSMDDSDEFSIQTNWMVINGIIPRQNISRKKFPSGCGEISDLSAAISPCPIQVIDYELFKDHPSVTKAARIHRTAATMSLNKSIRPNPDEMSRLNDIIQQPLCDLSQVESELIVKFLWSLVDKKQALLKSILSVVLCGLCDTTERSVVITQILSAWTSLDVDGALALLGGEIGTLHPDIASQVRGYAVDRLKDIATNREIQTYLFQLVQSLKYEPSTSPFSLLSTLLIDRACRDHELATSLFWHLESSSHDESLYDHHRQEFWRELGKTDFGRKIRAEIEFQCQFRLRLIDISQILRSSRPSGPPNLVSTSGGGGIDASSISNKTETLREAIRGNLVSSSSIIGRMNLSNRLNFPIVGGEMVEIPIPLDPNFLLNRIDEAKSFCLRSAKSPFVISCEVLNRKTKEAEIKRYMFKTGDDLRQDQLIIQFISLIDGMFKSYGLDLKLTPYKVLATSVDDGFVEFVSDSNTLSSILSNNNNDLMAYFRSIRPNEKSSLGVDPECLDTFSRSCAGYCAITYILGIGDRHMENLLVTSDGRLFHVDFGYILGRDPKPFPPPMKLCREMVEGMGGAGSVYYRSFVSKCTQAFLIMRRHANLIISLLYLTADANLKDMREQDPRIAIMKVQKRLMLEVSDEIAEQQMINLINESTNALFPVMIEKLHKYAMYWRQ